MMHGPLNVKYKYSISDYTFSNTPLDKIILNISLQADKVHATLPAIIATSQPILLYTCSAWVLP